ncbi:hypothetical protein TNCV_98621 [Trichonephila clavipes]|nr:hypothetical protein TNCV_98621 [Trichonephila clavipes]
MDSEDVQEMLDSYNYKLTMDQLIEMDEKERTIHYRTCVFRPSSIRKSNDGWELEGLNLIEKGLQILENIDSNEECIFILSAKQGKKLLAC